MADKRVLFVCEHNSARSQMAEAFLRQLGGEDFEVESAGLEPTGLNPLAVEVMREIGIDISGKKRNAYSSSSNRADFTPMSSPFATRPL